MLSLMEIRDPMVVYDMAVTAIAGNKRSGNSIDILWIGGPVAGQIGKWPLDTKLWNQRQRHEDRYWSLNAFPGTNLPFDS